MNSKHIQKLIIQRCFIYIIYDQRFVHFRNFTFSSSLSLLHCSLPVPRRPDVSVARSAGAVTTDAIGNRNLCVLHVKEFVRLTISLVEQIPCLAWDKTYFLPHPAELMTDWNRNIRNSWMHRTGCERSGTIHDVTWPCSVLDLFHKTNWISSVVGFQPIADLSSLIYSIYLFPNKDLLCNKFLPFKLAPVFCLLKYSVCICTTTGQFIPLCILKSNIFLYRFLPS